MISWETLLIAIFASSGLWSVITILVQNKLNKKNNLTEAQEKMNKLVMGLGHDRICFLGMAYVDRGYITKDEYEDLVTYLYTPYKNLEGNGTAELVMKKVQDLPVYSTTASSEINKTQINPENQYAQSYKNIVEHPLELK